MPETIKQERTIADIAAKPSANNAEWLRIHNNEVIETFRHSAAFAKYKEGEARLARLCQRHPDCVEHWKERDKHHREAFRKALMKINDGCVSAKEACTKMTAGVK
jgi:hypothetical protein